jgi:hypothetical protein
MKNLNIKKLLVIACLSLSLVFSARSVNAQVDVWGDPLSGKTVGLEAFTALGLGNRNPQTIIVAIVQIVLGFLGVLAVCLLLYGGFLGGEYIFSRQFQTYFKFSAQVFKTQFSGTSRASDPVTSTNLSNVSVSDGIYMLTLGVRLGR